eukprot:TRINITY_DN68390_c0_g1_i1.p1 TRINITY_DN68390_c0_g1~~TRINITY_DN68390_c0_g1_i1.p1  ORF type:complete len:172 (+),score=17.68 TRINITY_DN68390_c0_g1_i1:79-594(+)
MGSRPGLTSSADAGTDLPPSDTSSVAEHVATEGDLILSDFDPKAKLGLAMKSAKLLAVPQADESARPDLHASLDISASSTERTAELPSAGSTWHVSGTCTPCKFVRSKLGCKLGRMCHSCHQPHEELTSDSIRRQHRSTKKHVDRAIGASAHGEVVVDTLGEVWRKFDESI